MDAQKPKQPMSRVVKTVLILSLALNFVVLGLAAGAAWRFSGENHADRRGSPSVQSYGAPYIRALPREMRRELGRSLRRDGGLPDRAVRRAQYDQMVTLLRSTPFDADAVRDILADQRSTAEAFQVQAQNGWVALVTEMSQTERATLADKLQEQLARITKKREGKPDR
ncbi:Metal resist domain containing protein [Sulfitobacter noctilucae]|uniref:periplasmic heavy metal sensor n=1 Tax=Sulfitobacter noctilucae TaxID=1342302 RepID=UPI0004684906|nr:periplasmic heavy metal sensor [Sulfitobacter noctilucae]KIN60391.1 Metal resist domain containing protein [Sulfitobacter noctilucae]